MLEAFCPVGKNDKQIQIANIMKSPMFLEMVHSEERTLKDMLTQSI